MTIRIRRIDHVGIAVPRLDDALGAWQALGFRLERREDVPSESVRTAFLPVGESHLELLEASRPDSVIARFVEKRGGGVHHLCVEVDDVEAALVELKAKGVRLVDQTPRTGAGGCRVAFVHPKATGGVLLELKQAAAGASAGASAEAEAEREGEGEGAHEAE